MATPPSTETSEIRRRGRQRLIGAVAIAVLLVVFVPMILDSEPRRVRNEPAIEIPPKDNVPPLPPPAAPSAPAKAAAEPAKSPAPAAKPAAAAKSPAAVPAMKLVGFAVQVGAFKDDDKLRLAREKLSAAGIAHYTERRESPTGELTRLRAGPFPSRESAEKALAAIKSAALEGQVVPLP